MTDAEIEALFRQSFPRTKMTGAYRRFAAALIEAHKAELLKIAVTAAQAGYDFREREARIRDRVRVTLPPDHPSLSAIDSADSA